MLTVLLTLACTGQTDPAPTEPITPPDDPPAAQPEATPQPGPPPSGKAGKGPPPGHQPSSEGPHGGQGGHGGEGGGGGGSTSELVPLIEHVSNPTSGAKLATYMVTPVGDGPFPALVVIPGGTKEGTRAMRPPDWGEFVAAGFALVTFDPDGRGQSEGTEDYNGHTHQDGLAAIIDWAAGRAEIDGDRVGVLSYSYGVTMASGALTRHATPAKFFIDWEGPANRTFTAGCGDRELRGGNRSALSRMDCSDEAFWSQREASSFIGSLTIPYHRVQFTQDHAQPDSQSCVAMMVAAQAGEVPWTCVNDEPVEKTIDDMNDFATHGDQRDRTSVLVRYAVSLMEQTTGAEMVEGEVPASLQNLSAGGGPGGKGGKGKRGR